MAAYAKAKELLQVNQESFMPYSVRDQVLNEVLREAYKAREGAIPDLPLPGTSYRAGPQPLPLAVRRNPKNKEVVTWTGSDVVLGNDLIQMIAGGASPAGYGRFHIMDNTICKKLVFDKSGTKVIEAEVFDSKEGTLVSIQADTFVIAAGYRAMQWLDERLAAGTVMTSQILWKSLEEHECGSARKRLPALGRYLTEQPMAFCQVVWRGDIVANKFLPRWHGTPTDVIPIPSDDPEPNQWIPVSDGRPWHAQIHRDAFAYGDTGPNVDSRMIVDLCFFGIVDQHEYNHVEFETCNKLDDDLGGGVHDLFDMPQPTFHYRYNSEEEARMHDMMEDMVYYATKIGAFLPGSEPQFMKPGLTLHIHGTTRIGTDSTDSVISRVGVVHGMTNLYLGGNGVIPRAIACNPTVTAISDDLPPSMKFAATAALAICQG